jgi:hypothetical protein
MFSQAILIVLISYTNTSTSVLQSGSTMLPRQLHISHPVQAMQYHVILRSECGGTWCCMGGEVKGKLANGVGSQYSQTPSERGVSSITNADMHTSAASSQLN